MNLPSSIFSDPLVGSIRKIGFLSEIVREDISKLENLTEEIKNAKKNRPLGKTEAIFGPLTSDQTKIVGVKSRSN